MNTGLNNLNPLTAFIYLILAAVLSMILSDPLLAMVGLIFVLLWCFSERCEMGSSLMMVMWTGLLVLVVNPFLNHRGMTILFYFFGNPVTLEAFLYGFTSALSIMTVFLVFIVYNKVITPDKFMMLFSGKMPRTSLLIMMCFRFIPALRRQYTELSGVQKLKHPTRKDQKPSVKEKIKEAFRLLSLLFTVSICEAIETAQSMRARGYGIYAKRTSWRVSKITFMDICSLIYIGLIFLLTVGIWYGGSLKQDFYRYGYNPVTNLWIYLGAFLFYSYPLILKGVERLKWNYLNWNN